MKITLFLLIVFWGGVAFSSQTMAIRVSQYNKNFNESFLLEVFYFNFLSADLSILESKFRHDSSLSLNGPKGFFLLGNEKVTWRKEDYIIQPGTFSILLKNSKREIKFSGNLDNISNNHCDVDLNYTFLRPIKTEYGVGQDFFSFSSNCSLKFGQIQVCGVFEKTGE